MPWVVAAVNYNDRRRPFTRFDAWYDGNLGSVYTLLTEILQHRGDWQRKRAERIRQSIKLPRHFDLLLGTAQGKGIPWDAYWQRGCSGAILVNYYYGFEQLTRKDLLLKTLKRAEAACHGGLPRSFPHNLMSSVPDGGTWELMPTSFAFNPYEPSYDFYSSFHAAFSAAARGSPGGPNAWIVKPVQGSKGEGIFISDSFAEIAEVMQEEMAYAAYGERACSWLVQRYISDPLTLTGGRKCDVRVWVLLDADYSIWLYMQGVVRLAAVAYRPRDLSNIYSHLTNHCIAETHAAFGDLPPLPSPRMRASFSRLSAPTCSRVRLQARTRKATSSSMTNLTHSSARGAHSPYQLVMRVIHARMQYPPTPHMRAQVPGTSAARVRRSKCVAAPRCHTTANSPSRHPVAPCCTPTVCLPRIESLRPGSP